MKREDIRQLEAILGCGEFSESIIKLLSDIEHNYHTIKKWPTTRRAEEKKEHEKIKKAAKRMLDILRANPDLVKILIEADNKMNPGSRNLSFQSFVCCHEALVKGCDWFLANVHIDKGGHPDESLPLRSLINGLVYVYVNVTGEWPTHTWNNYEEKYVGKFFEFVKAWLDIIEPRAYWSNNALGKQITRTLKVLSKETSFYSLSRT